MRVALGSDHAGFDLKERLKRFLDEVHVPYEDLGCPSPEPVDYPDIAAAVSGRVVAGAVDRGILICGTGIGMAIAANKVPGIRAAAPCSAEAVALARGHNNLNVLALGARTTPADTACAFVRTFLDTPFDGGRHQRRIDKIAALETGRTTSSEVRGPKSEVRSPESGVRGPKSDVRGPTSEVRPSTGSGRGELAEPRSPTSEV
jgi:ribose 5-phosphate isomerase B